MSALITYEQLKKDPAVLTYIRHAGDYAHAIGYIHHGLDHASAVADRAASLLEILGYDTQYVESVKIAALLHDIGNLVNRTDHAQSSACMAFSLLERMQMDPDRIAEICTAIGNHDEHTGLPVSPAAAAIILADKTDVRRSRVRDMEGIPTVKDIHNRVNYAVTETTFTVHTDTHRICWAVELDPAYAAPEDFMKIYTARMNFAVQAAARLHLTFHLYLNGNEIPLQ